MIIASISYALGNFNARDTISRPDMSWALGSAPAIRISDLSISLEHAANTIRERNPNATAAELGVAYDYLTELLAASLEMHLAKGDPAEPKFTNWMSDYRKFLGDSPDAIYSTAPIDADTEYEIAITAGSADYLGIVIYDRNPITGWNRVADSVSVLPGPRGSVFRIPVTSHPTHYSDNTRAADKTEGTLLVPSVTKASDVSMSKNDIATEQLVLRLSPNSHMIMVREYYFNSEAGQPSELTIKALPTHDQANTANVGTTPFEKRAENAVNFFNQTWQGTLALADALKATTNNFDRPATVSPDFVGVFYPTPDNEYHGGSFSLTKGQTLIVEGTVPAAAFWSITLQNHWMQSIETNGQAASLTGSQITNRKGHYRVWISDTAPPAGEDWLNTGDETEGLVAIRYLLADNAPAPKARLHTATNMSEANQLK